jgi:periplasmic copper chaperone A
VLRHPSKFVAAAVTSVAVIGLSAGAAWAHVTIQPPTAVQGSFSKLTFRVPNEESSADTTQLEVQFPPDHPIPSVSVQPKDGWTYKVTTTKLAQPLQTDDGQVTEAVSDILWTGGTIKPGEFDEFSVSAGPLPTNVDSLEFKAVQTYSDGDVVRWIQDTPPGGPEPEHPAPVLTLVKASTDPAGSGGSDSDGTARVLGIVGIVLGVAGVAFGAGALVASRRRTPAADPGASSRGTSS